MSDVTPDCDQMYLIRDYSPQDAAQLEHCIVELQSFEKAMEPNRADGCKIEPAYRELLLAQCDQSQGKILVAVADETVVAFICVLVRVETAELIEETSDHAYITDLVVLPTHRGRGIGKALLRHAEEYARHQGAGVLKVDVLAANMVARELYTQLGYQAQEIRLQKRLPAVSPPAPSS